MVEKRRVGSSEIEVAPLVLGGNIFDWTADEATSFKILDAFVDAGGTMIDTADVYSAWAPGHQGGESESVIGRWLKRDPAKRVRVQIATKVGFLGCQIVGGDYVAALQPAHIRSACDASLGRLGIDTIDLYYEHKDNPDIPLADSLGAMDELVKAGKVRAVGLSQFTAPRLDEAMRTAEAESITKPCALQTWYNMVEREKLEGDLLDTAMKHGLGVLPFYGLASGFLSGKYRTREDLEKSVRGQRSAEYLQGNGLRVLAALDQVAAETGSALATIAIAWTIAQPGITAALASATNLDQLAELTAAMHLELRPDQTARLTEASADVVTA